MQVVSGGPFSPCIFCGASITTYKHVHSEDLKCRSAILSEVEFLVLTIQHGIAGDEANTGAKNVAMKTISRVECG